MTRTSRKDRAQNIRLSAAQVTPVVSRRTVLLHAPSVQQGGGEGAADTIMVSAPKGCSIVIE